MPSESPETRSPAEALGDKLRAVVADYRRDHPEIDDHDVHRALDMASAESPTSRTFDVVPGFGEGRKGGLLGVFLVIFAIVATAAAVYLIRRP